MRNNYIKWKESCLYYGKIHIKKTWVHYRGILPAFPVIVWDFQDGTRRSGKTYGGRTKDECFTGTI